MYQDSKFTAINSCYINGSKCFCLIVLNSRPWIRISLYVTTRGPGSHGVWGLSLWEQGIPRLSIETWRKILKSDRRKWAINLLKWWTCFKMFRVLSDHVRTWPFPPPGRSSKLCVLNPSIPLGTFPIHLHWTITVSVRDFITVINCRSVEAIKREEENSRK